MSLSILSQFWTAFFRSCTERNAQWNQITKRNNDWDRMNIDCKTIIHHNILSGIEKRLLLTSSLNRFFPDLWGGLPVADQNIVFWVLSLYVLRTQRWPTRTSVGLSYLLIGAGANPEYGTRLWTACDHSHIGSMHVHTSYGHNGTRSHSKFSKRSS
jgi:hypothetical protein